MAEAQKREIDNGVCLGSRGWKELIESCSTGRNMVTSCFGAVGAIIEDCFRFYCVDPFLSDRLFRTVDFGCNEFYSNFSICSSKY